MTEPAEPLITRLIEEGLLGGPVRYRRKEVEALSGVSDEYGERIWRAFGFPTPPEDEVAFTDTDVEALREIKRLLGNELVDEDMVVHMARAVGQTMGRLANWLEGFRLEWLSATVPEDKMSSPESVAMMFEATDDLRPGFEKLLLHGWRRQIAAAGIRSMSSIAAAKRDPATGTALMAVGFADIVSFTRLSRRMDGAALAGFVERFEATTSEEISEWGGRLVKTLGDEVFFATDEPRAAAEIGLHIAERCEQDPDFPRVRVGLAHGEVIHRLGDVFGTPVNLAARLTSIAYPSTVLIDGEMARVLADDKDYDISTLRARPLQGLGRVRPRVIRRGRD